MNRMLKFESFVSEGVRDVLRPKSKEDIKKSLKGQPRDVIYLKLLQYKVGDEILNILKSKTNYFKVYYDDYYNLHDVYKKIFFNDTEKQEIDKLIDNQKVAGEYRYITPNLESFSGELYCLEIREKDRKFIVDKYENYITVEIIKGIHHEYYICPSIKQLLEFMDDYMIIARKMN